MAGSRVQLVLDVGGVVLADLTPTFWRWVATQENLPHAAVVTRFRAEVREDLWTGTLSEEQFWTWCGHRFPRLNLATARDMLAASLRRLPATRQLGHWARCADLHLLSNHRAEWALPALAAFQTHFARITISSTVGMCKPDPAIYAIVAAHLPAGAPVIFVDDQARNFPSAVALGWTPLLADAEGDWLATLESLLVTKETAHRVERQR